MKKLFALLALIALGMTVQSCGSAEKCPAYTQADSAEEGRV